MELKELIVFWKLQGIVTRDFICGGGWPTVVLEKPNSGAQVYVWYTAESYEIREIQKYTIGIKEELTLEETIKWASL